MQLGHPVRAGALEANNYHHVLVELPGGVCVDYFLLAGKDACRSFDRPALRIDRARLHDTAAQIAGEEPNSPIARKWRS